MTKNNPPTHHDQAQDSDAESVAMASSTLTIKVNYSTAAGFTFYLEHIDGTTTWTRNLVDGDTVAFVNDGNYQLFDPTGASAWFTFNAVDVSLGSSLAGTASKVCGSTNDFKFPSIQFPKLGSAALVANLYAWCQGLPSSSADVAGAAILMDPKLGLSNSKGSTGFQIPTTSVSCSCSS